MQKGQRKLNPAEASARTTSPLAGYMQRALTPHHDRDLLLPVQKYDMEEDLMLYGRRPDETAMHVDLAILRKYVAMSTSPNDEILANSTWSFDKCLAWGGTAHLTHIYIYTHLYVLSLWTGSSPSPLKSKLWARRHCKMYTYIYIYILCIYKIPLYIIGLWLFFGQMLQNTSSEPKGWAKAPRDTTSPGAPPGPHNTRA